MTDCALWLFGVQDTHIQNQAFHGLLEPLLGVAERRSLVEIRWSQGQKVLGHLKVEGAAAVGAADALRRVPFSRTMEESRTLRIPHCTSLINDADQFLNFFIAEISLNIQELFCPFFILTVLVSTCELSPFPSNVFDMESFGEEKHLIHSLQYKYPGTSFICR